MKKAILIIHGFIGSLSDNEFLQDYLTYEKDFDVFARTLPGHSKGEDYQKVEYHDWIKFVDMEIGALIKHGYKNIYLIGHSMGGLLAGYGATKYKEVKKVVLLNTPYTSLNLKQTKINILENKDYKDYIDVFDRVLHTTIPFFLEFVKLVKEYHQCLENIETETLILQSEIDQIIPIETSQEIYENLKIEDKYLTYIEGEKHTVFGNKNGDLKRKQEIADYIKTFLKGGNKWRKLWKEKI